MLFIIYKKLLSLLFLSSFLFISACEIVTNVDDDSSSTLPAPVTDPTNNTDPDSDPSTAEYNAQGGLDLMNADEAYALGATGSGVTVAVIDTGVDSDHPDLKDKISANSYDFISNDTDARPDGQGDAMSHGTHVAGVIAASKNDSGMHGVAYNATILALRAGTSDGGLSYAAIENSIDRAIESNAQVINASFGSQSLPSKTKNKWKDAHNADIVTVHATGNEKKDIPDYGARLPADAGYEDLAKTLIAVSATDANGDFDSRYSNKCGIAKEWCLAARGTDIYATVATNDDDAQGALYVGMTGTSMAAPQVSGAVAVLRSQWPSKSAEEIVNILYDTAEDKGEKGTDELYGRGLLDLGNAVSAQGVLSLYTVSGESYALSASSLSSSSALGNALNQPVSTAVYDKYKRDFYVDLNNNSAETSNIADELAFSSGGVSKVSFTSGVSLAGNLKTGAVQVQGQFDDVLMSFSQKQNPAEVFAFNQLTDVGGVSDTYSLYGDSYLSMIENGKTLNFTTTGNIQTSIGLVSGFTDDSGEHAMNGVNLSGKFKPTQDLSITAQLSQIKENDTFLSSYFSGAYQTGVADTRSINFIAESNISPKLNFIAQYNQGLTQVKTLDNSVVSDVSDISSSGYSMSLVGSHIYNRGDKLFTTFKQPMKVSSGEMTLTNASGLNADDSISFTDENVSLSPTGTEKILTLGYSTEYNRDTNIVALINYINNPNHDLSAQSEGQIMLKIKQKF